MMNYTEAGLGIPNLNIKFDSVGRFVSLLRLDIPLL